MEFKLQGGSVLGFGKKEVTVDSYFGELADKLGKIEAVAESLASLEGQITAATEISVYVDEIEGLRRDKQDAEIELEKLREDHQRETREIEHKLGLHRKQIESEREIMTKEAAAERVVAVEEARLAVREGNLDAEKKRFEEEINFRTKRFEEEAKTLRDLTGQILARLPNVTASFNHNIGDSAPAAEKPKELNA